jgi:hypothetical protein
MVGMLWWPQALLLMELHIEDENTFQNNLTVFPEKFHKLLREISGYIASSNEGCL